MKKEINFEKYILERTTRSENGCLLWIGGKEGRAGWFQHGGIIGSAPICVYKVRKGPIPEGKILRHSCDNPKCVEIAHLIPGTKKENRRDFMERHPRAMELCLQAAKTGAKGVKKFWDSMTPEKRAEFIKSRSEKFKEKVRSQPGFYKTRVKNTWRTRRARSGV